MVRRNFVIGTQFIIVKFTLDFNFLGLKAKS